jgi:hypothetical protein
LYQKLYFSRAFADIMQVKAKLKAWWAEQLQSLEACRARFAELWSDVENALLFRAVLGFAGSALLLLFGTSGLMVAKFLNGSHTSVAVEEQEKQGKEVVEHAASDSAPSFIALNARVLPRSITNRQDGVPEADKDLVQSEIKEGRGLASIGFNQEIEIAPYNPYFTYYEILGSTSERAAHVGRVALDVSFEVDTSAGMKELQEREKEIKFMISSLIAEMGYDELRTDEGRLNLKKRIFKEVNYVLKKGKVRDVLYSSFVMK